jgi:hypothetical protein
MNNKDIFMVIFNAGAAKLLLVDDKNQLKVYLTDGVEIDSNDVLLSDLARDQFLVLAHNDQFVEGK